MEANYLELKKNVIEVKGTIHFDNVVPLLKQGIAFINTLENIKVDLKNLLQCDSSGLALLVAWVRAAQEQHRSIVFIHVPNFMQDIVRVYGLDGILPVSWEN